MNETDAQWMSRINRQIIADKSVKFLRPDERARYDKIINAENAKDAADRDLPEASGLIKERPD